MKVKEVYKKYKIPLNLQKHMLRVAALSQIFAENWENGKLDSKSITLTCVFHDMANIIKFNFEKPSLFKDEEDKVDYWKKVQKEVIQKYGNNVHLATLTISKEIGLSEKVINFIKNLEWDNTLKILEEKNFESALTIYCDMRIGPHGIMLLKDRIDDLQKRNKSHDMNSIKKAANLLEKTIQQFLSIDVNSVNNLQINSRWRSLFEHEV